MSSSSVRRQCAATTTPAGAMASPPTSSVSSSALIPPPPPTLLSQLSLPPLLRATSTPIRFDDKDWAALIEASEKDALIETGIRQTRRRLSSISADLPSLSRASSSGTIKSPISSQVENDSGHDSLGDATQSPSSDELSSIAGVSSASPSPFYDSTASKNGSSSSSSGYESLGARPKTWTRSRTNYKRDRDLSRHDSGLSVSNNASVSSLTSFASSKSCIVYRHRVGHFIGRERMDFVRYLSEMNMDHVVEKIFSFLDATDLCRVACTSTRWQNRLMSDTPSNLKRMDFLIDCKKNRENLERSFRAPRLTPRKALGNVLNYQSKTKREREEESSRSANVVSPSKARHHLFRENAAKLSPGEELQRCPRCTFPSVVDLSVSSVASCTSRSCSFSFCTRCRCAEHGPDTCRQSAAAASAAAAAGGGKATSSATPASSSSSGATVASKKSKRRLKRL